MSFNDISRIAVIGAGNVGKAMAAHLRIMGYEVNLYNRTEEKIQSLKKDNRIEICGVIEGCPRINLITSDIRKAIENVNLIMVTIPASGHKSLANILGPHLQKNQIVVLNPGRTLGSLEFTKILNKYNKNNVVSETQTIIYTTRYCDNKSEVFAIKRKVPFATFPACKTKEVLALLKPIFSEFTIAKDTLEIGLANIGAILHPAPTLLNTGRIEDSCKTFKYYYEGITPSIAQFLEAIDHERLEIAKAYGYKVLSVKDWLHEAYGARGHNLYETLHNNDAYSQIDAPQKILHRYILEDIPTGLVPLSSIGQKIQNDTSNINAVIDLASKITVIDFYKCGRTLEKCGISDMTIEEILGYFHNGEEV